MAAQLPPLNASQSIVNKDGTMTDQFRDLINDFFYALPLTGSGTPEGNLEALQFSVYLDTAGVPGTLQYRKMLPSILGDKTKGWVLV